MGQCNFNNKEQHSRLEICQALDIVEALKHIAGMSQS